jgi:hypothetical protein
MKYMLMICDDESVTLSPAEVHALPQIQALDAGVDGPGAGFDIIECASIDEAVEIAARHLAAAGGAIEVRPLWQE